MKLPVRLPALKPVTVITMAYGVLWIALEGNLLRVTLLGCLVTFVLVGNVFQRWIAGRTLAVTRWLILCGALGTLAGFASAVSTLVFMAVKTGLHAHGPEFTPSEVQWIVDQIPWWTGAGLLVGLGLASLYAVLKQS